MRNKVFITVIVVAVIVGGAYIAKSLILGNAEPVITSQNSIKDTTSQSLGGSPDAKLDPSASLPVEGKDYTIDKQQYFEGKNWVVIHVSPTNPNAADPAWIVMKLDGDKYTTVIGPGTYFPASTLKNKNLPTSVTDYLNKNGVL
jgi:hypothetical protein